VVEPRGRVVFGTEATTLLILSDVENRGLLGSFRNFGLVPGRSVTAGDERGGI
jgi:hypothetical protein